MRRLALDLDAARVRASEAVGGGGSGGEMGRSNGWEANAEYRRMLSDAY